MKRTTLVLVTVTIALVSSILSATAQDRSTGTANRCGSDPRTALFEYFGYNDDQVRDMQSTRSISLPRMDRGDQVEFHDYVRRYLQTSQPSGLVHYASDGEFICGFLWTGERLAGGARDPIYFRRRIGADTLRRLQSELAGALDVESVWRSRSNSGMPPKRAPETPRPLSEIVRDISDILFPVELRETLKTLQHLSILPIQGMSAIPVGLLQPLGDGRAAVDVFSVTFLAFLADIKEGAEPWRGGFVSPVVIGNPRPSVDKDYVWAPLPGAESEAKAVHAKLGGKIYLREAATSSAIEEGIWGRDLFYFAGHGFADPGKDLENSYIVLADGRLTARQIQSLKLDRRPLVVLSACHTGEGYAMEAGIVGLARAFQIAGARNTIMSLWAVDDAATETLMSTLVDVLNKYAPAEALRHAAVETRKRYPNPAIWAAFNVFGNQARR